MWGQKGRKYKCEEMVREPREPAGRRPRGRRIKGSAGSLDSGSCDEVDYPAHVLVICDERHYKDSL